jgi:hypothetical protein
MILLLTLGVLFVLNGLALPTLAATERLREAGVVSGAVSF